MSLQQMFDLALLQFSQVCFLGVHTVTPAEGPCVWIFLSLDLDLLMVPSGCFKWLHPLTALLAKAPRAPSHQQLLAKMRKDVFYIETGVASLCQRQRFTGTSLIPFFSERFCFIASVTSCMHVFTELIAVIGSSDSWKDLLLKLHAEE